VVKKGTLILIGAIVVVGFYVVHVYNSLVGLDQAVSTQWGQVQNMYQRRADLIPNLVETVKGAANFEKETYVAVAEARSKVGQITAEGAQKILTDPQMFQRFQQAQGELSASLSKLMAVSERYPDLKATAAFRDLQTQLEGTENRVAVERMRFNEVAGQYNSRRQQFPTVLIAGLFGSKFAEKPYFAAQAGAEVAPKVKF
jgi:LemA protein